MKLQTGLAEHLPLEQGLRQVAIKLDVVVALSRRASSIRTRIKTVAACLVYHVLDILAEHLPLEQGLRPFLDASVADLCVLAEHLPLEQGLRHTYFEVFVV